jgi:hypothetical protein
MNNKLISTIVGAALSSLVATTGYAWQKPSQPCLDARVNHAIVMDTILVCKDYDPYGSWICTKPSREVATHEKKNTLAVVRYECKGERLADQIFFKPENILPPQISSPSPPLSPACPSAEGEWNISFDWNCDDSSSNARITFNADFTTTPYSGEWTQNDCTFGLQFQTYGTIYHGTMTSDGTSLSGDMSTTTGGGFEGCWTATPVDPMPAGISGISAIASTSEPSDGGISVDGSEN